MKHGWRNICVLALAAACLLAAGCADKAGKRGDPQATTAALAITYQLAGHHLPQVYARFDAALKQALPPSRMATLWHGLESKYGSFDSASAVETRRAGSGKTNVVVACHFLKGNQFLVWTMFNTNLQVTGLHLAGGS